MTRHRTVRLFLAIAVVIAAAGSGYGQLILNNVPVKRFDLVVEGPSMPRGVLKEWVNLNWTVRNAGPDVSPETVLRLACTVLFVEAPQSRCNTYGQLGDIPVPPLMPGDTYQISREMFNAYGYVDPSKGVASLYRFMLTAAVDPASALAESNETNNKINFMAENFQGAPPSPQLLAIVTIPPPPAPNVTAGAAGDVIAALPQLQVAPMTNPWDPTKTAWIMVKNIGGQETAAAKLEHNCFRYTFTVTWGGIVADSHSCLSDPFPSLVDIPPLKPGEFKALGQFLGPQGGSFYYGPNGYPDAFRAGFHIIASVPAKDVVLATYIP